jgi:hypothetical protein
VSRASQSLFHCLIAVEVTEKDQLLMKIAAHEIELLRPEWDVVMARDIDTSNPFWEPEQSTADNPFDNDSSELPDESIDSLLASSGNQTPVPLDSTATTLPDVEERATLTWDQIATFLLRKNLHLTALEFHTELYERGIQLPR